MRRPLVTLIALAAALSMSGCASDSGRVDPSPTETVSLYETASPVETASPSSEPAPQSASSCDEAMKVAAAVPLSEVNDAEMAATLDACADRAEWEASLRSNPGAIGLPSLSAQEVEVIHSMLCDKKPSAAACTA